MRAFSASTTRNLARIAGLSLVLFFTCLHAGWLTALAPLYTRIQLIAYDQAINLLPPPTLCEHVPLVIVDIDERSLQVEGRWPWPRERMADLVDALAEAGTAVVAFDVLFAEPQRNVLQEVLETLAREDLYAELGHLQTMFDQDALFAQSLARHPVVLGYVFRPLADGLHIGQLPLPLPLSAPLAPPVRVAIPDMAGYSAPLKILMQHATGAGFFSIEPDIDGIVRRIPLLVQHQGDIYPSIAVEVVRHYLFLDAAKLYTEPIKGIEHLRWLQLDLDLKIPTDGRGQLLVPYRGPYGSFPYVSATDVLTGKLDQTLLEGAIILVGTTAPGLFDLRATPVQAVYPGVEIQANVIAAILGNAFLVEPSWSQGASLVYLFVLGCAVALIFPMLGMLRQTGTLLLLILLTLGIHTWLWTTHGMVLDIAGVLLLISVLFFFNLGWGFFFETRHRIRLKNMFGQYVPPALVDEMSERPGDFGFAGQSRELSVLFADIRNFTSISEQLPADELKQLLNSYFTPMTRIIFEHRGTIDKYVGDMVMAFWGAPVDDAKHAKHAIEAAMAMLVCTQALRLEFRRLGWPEMTIGIGINTGIMNVGDMGSSYRRAYTVLGDAVNLASRLESATKYYDVDVLVGERTYALTKTHFLWRELDLVKVKGKIHPIVVYQPVCRIEAATQAHVDEMIQMTQALQAFRSQQWDQAKMQFTQLAHNHSEIFIYRLYLQRIKQMQNDPPPLDWDGSWILTQK